MIKATRKLKDPFSPVRVRPATRLKLMRIRAARGWSLTEAVDRMCDRELAVLAEERRLGDAAAPAP